MKIYTFRITVLIFALLMPILLLPGCTQPLPENDTQETVPDIDVSFISDKEISLWREPLEALLVNARDMASEDEDVPTNPHLPTIYKGYDCGLLDVNFDGTPEVIINLGGGSAGNAYYNVYDLYTGADLGSFDGGMNESWIVTYHLSDHTFAYRGDYQWREGAGLDHIFYATILYDQERQIYMTDILSQKTVVTSGWTDDPPTYHYYSMDKKVTEDVYQQAMNEDKGNYYPIDGTAMITLSWWDLETDEDTYETLAKKMTDALLATGQKFILSNKQA